MKENNLEKLYYIIGTLQGYACGLECSERPNLDVLIEGLKSCAEVLEQIGVDER